MEKQNQKSTEDRSLRHKAEEKIEKDHGSNVNHSDTLQEQKPSEDEMKKLIHELQVYQIELEMQNDELHRAVEKAAIATELYDFAPAGYFTLRPDSTITQLNFSGAKMLGKERLNLINLRLNQLLSPASFMVFNEFMRNIFDTRVKQSCEIALSVPDKASGFLYLEGIVTADKQKCMVTAVDITERKRMEEALRESEARFRSTFDQSPVGSVMTSLDMRLIRCNAAFCSFLGYSENELIGKTIKEVTFLEDEAIAKKEINELLEGKLETAVLQKRYVRKDGRVVWGEISICLIRDEDNNPLYFLPIIQDITERRQAEEALHFSELKYRRLHETMMDGFVYVDMKGNIREFNETYRKMLGYERDEILNLNFLDLTPLLWHEIEIRIIEEQILRNGYSQVYEKEYIRKDGTIFPVELRTFLVKNEDNVNEGMWAIVRDITERKQAERRQADNEARLRELIATRDKFFSIIAHDLRSPFNGILGFSNILVGQIEEKNYEGIENYARIILNSSQRAMSLLMNLLEWSRSQTGRMKFSPEYVEMVALMNEIIELFIDSSTQKSITIFRELPRTIHAFVDKAMISTVLRNLISNAVKFTNPGGEIYISAEQKPDEILFSVSDTGVGIKKEALGKLFQIESSSSTKGTSNEGGTGLGLILCKEFVDKHGGKMWVESEYGIGSTFSFTIPVKMVI